MSVRGSLTGHHPTDLACTSHQRERRLNRPVRVTVSAVGGYPYAPHMTIPSGGILIGYARCSTDEQDLTAQRLAEQDPDLEPDRGLTGSAPKTSPAARTIREVAAAVTPALGTYPAGRKGCTFDRRMSGSVQERPRAECQCPVL